MKHEVLYQRLPFWLVGESKDEAASRRRDVMSTSLPTSQWPNDYAGRVVSIRRSGRKGRGPSLRNMAGDLLRVVELDLTAEEVTALRNRTQKMDDEGMPPVTFDDRWGAVATTLRANIDDPEAVEARSFTSCEDTDIDVYRFAELSALAKSMLPKTITNTGTGLYATKVTPAKVDDVQSGAPAGQVITLVTGGLGTSDAFKGGYVKNTGILSATDDQPTATGAAAPAGHAWDASVTAGGAYLAADDNAATTWLGAWTGPEWWRYIPPTSKTYGKVSIQAKTVITAGRLPKDFKAQGWNGSSWIDLLTVTGETGWIAAEKRSWEFTTNIDSYSEYRLYITDNNGDAFIEIAEVEWFATTEEIRATVSHTDDTVTLEGSLTNWTDTDTVEVYDAWSTIQAAIDQSFTDQGSALLTESQYFRIFAGTYDETPTFTNSFNADLFNGHIWIVEGDPTDDRANIIIAPTSGSPTIGINVGDTESMIVRHLTIAGTPSNASIFFAFSSYAEVKDCVVTSTGNAAGISAQDRLRVLDCSLTLGGTGIAISSADLVVEGCDITGVGSGDGMKAGKALIVRNSTFRSLGGGACAVNVAEQMPIYEVAHCSFYDCSMAFQIQTALSRMRLINNIVENCVRVIYRRYAMPGETADQYQSEVLMRNNCFFNNTDFATGGPQPSESYATFTAREFVDAEGDILVDPLLSDPAAGDFSLQDASPCINTGHGSGVVTGQNGVAFDANNPDIGAWSSGAVATHLVPVLDSWSNVGDGDSVSLAVSNVETFRTVHIFYRLAGSLTAFSESPTTRVGPGDVILAGLEDGSTYEVYVISSNGTSSDQPSLPSNSLSVTPSTVTVGAEKALEGQGGLDLQLDEDCGDLEIVNLDLALVDGTVQVKQALCIALRMFRGEWFLDGNAGVPYYQDVLVKTPNLSEINSILKTEILKVENVNKILEFTSTFDSPNRELSVSFRVDTVFGPVTIEETL